MNDIEQINYLNGLVERVRNSFGRVEQIGYYVNSYGELCEILKFISINDDLKNGSND